MWGEEERHAEFGRGGLWEDILGGEDTLPRLSPEAIRTAVATFPLRTAPAPDGYHPPILR